MQAISPIDYEERMRWTIFIVSVNNLIPVGNRSMKSCGATIDTFATAQQQAKSGFFLSPLINLLSTPSSIISISLFPFLFVPVLSLILSPCVGLSLLLCLSRHLSISCLSTSLSFLSLYDSAQG